MQGQTCLEDGELLGPAECGILATVGAAQVSVHRYNDRLHRSNHCNTTKHRLCNTKVH